MATQDKLKGGHLFIQVYFDSIHRIGTLSWDYMMISLTS